MNPTTPRMQHLPAITHPWFSLFRFRSPLLTESLLFSLPVGTEMFHFPTFPPHTLYIQVRVTRHHSCWVSPFGHPRISARLTAPRGLSQPPTSFIGSWCQGIHRTLFITYNKDARVHCAVLKQHTTNQSTSDTRPPGQSRRRGMTCSAHLSLLPRKKHSRVLSGPNSVSIYSLADRPLGTGRTREKLVSVPPMSVRRSTCGNETVSARARPSTCSRQSCWRCAP